MRTIERIGSDLVRKKNKKKLFIYEGSSKRKVQVVLHMLTSTCSFVSRRHIHSTRTNSDQTKEHYKPKCKSTFVRVLLYLYTVLPLALSPKARRGAEPHPPLPPPKLLPCNYRRSLISHDVNTILNVLSAIIS